MTKHDPHQSPAVWHVHAGCRGCLSASWVMVNAAAKRYGICWRYMRYKKDDACFCM